MKRDMDLIRKILQQLQDSPGGWAPDLEIEGYSEEQIGYHCLILWEAGLIDAVEDTTLGSPGPTASPRRLTWSGHDFVESASNERVWSEAKQAVGKVGDASFAVWTSVLSAIVKESLGLGS